MIYPPFGSTSTAIHAVIMQHLESPLEPDVQEDCALVSPTDVMRNKINFMARSRQSSYDC